VKASSSLNLFFFGPGVGEAIAIQLPCGRWGVVDCYKSASAENPPILKFLVEKGVKKLAFFCLTHPHADHFTGADQLLNHFKGNIERVWRYGGLSKVDVSCKMTMARKMTMAAFAKNKRTGDPEAEQMASNFGKVLTAIKIAKASLTNDTYVRVSAPMLLLQGAGYKISAMRPDGLIIDKIEDQICSKAADKGFLLFNEEEGSLLNPLSVVLQIEFGDARVILLGDAEGATDVVDSAATGFTGVKIAHHGSSNGWGANGMLKPSAASAGIIRFGVITPYLRSRLPKPDMVERYRAATRELIVTGNPIPSRAKSIVPGLANARLMNSESPCHGVKIFSSGRVQKIPIS
jgi:beta-lactamase superfamily II metal-dependent hydrolase